MSVDGAAGTVFSSTRAIEGVSPFGESDKYRQEAASIRQAAEIIRDECFRDQLLSIAQQYEAVATGIEIEQARQRAQTTIGGSQPAHSGRNWK
jgi:hypothetical protein